MFSTADIKEPAVICDRVADPGNLGTIIRTAVSSINVYSRTAGGVKVMNVDDDAIISNIVRIMPENELAEVEAEIEKTAHSAPVAEKEAFSEENGEE